MTERSGIDWDEAFDNIGHIPDAMRFPEIWASKAASWRQRVPHAEVDIAYGDQERERYDLFFPQNHPVGLLVFVHGGYWQKFDKSFWSHLATGPLERGWAVAVPNYSMAPAATLPEMVHQIARAIAHAARTVSGPVHLAGHSAGGHLVTRMLCNTSPLPRAVRDRVGKVFSISGLHDLRPLLLTHMASALHLTEDIARAESTALQLPCEGAANGLSVTAWVGARERPEFLRQSAILAENWSERGVDAALVAEPGRHHFDVIAGLEDPAHQLTLRLTHPDSCHGCQASGL